MSIRPLDEKDREFIIQVLQNLWGSEKVVYSGKIFDASVLPGFLAEEEGRVVGLVTYTFTTPDKTTCQIISLNALIPGKGIGTALIEEVKKIAKENGCKELMVITTNDNLPALKFYQKRGFVLEALFPNALEASRKIKPQIPLLGIDGIPLRDELSLTLHL